MILLLQTNIQINLKVIQEGTHWKNDVCSKSIYYIHETFILKRESSLSNIMFRILLNTISVQQRVVLTLVQFLKKYLINYKIFQVF